MSKSYLTLPTRDGWLVEWETGETITIGGVEKKRHGNFETMNKEEADRKAAQLQEQGFQNVKVMECIF